MCEKLTEPQILHNLEALCGWSREAESITREFRFKSFLAAIEFVNRVADEAERDAHHPDIDIRYSRVSLRLTTHSAGGLTDKDFALASRLNAIASEEEFR